MNLEPHVKRIAIAVVLGSIMSVLSTTIVNVALETLSVELHSPLDSVQWVVTSYMLALAAVIPVSGWAAARFGARRLYIIALTLFTAGSTLCGFAWNLETLVAARVLQGLAGGMLVPIGQIALVRAAGPHNMARVMAAIGVPIILAPVFGPTIGGLLIEHISWQAIFFVNLPVGIVAVIAAFKLLPRDSAGDAGQLDFIGLGLAATGLVAVTYGLAETGTAGSFAATEVLVPFVAGLALIGAFVARALRIPNPLLDVRLYANKAFSAAAVTTFALGAVLFGGMVLLPLYFQIVRQEDAVITGLLLIPQGIGAALAMAQSGRLTERLGGGLTSLVGGAVMIGATLPFVLIDERTPFWTMELAMIVRGFGIGLSMMPAMTAAYATLRSDQVKDATPQLNVLQRVRGSIGTAILTVVLQNGFTSNAPAAMAASFAHTFWWVVGIGVVAMLPTIMLAVIERRRVAEPATGELAVA
jgi:EmrB/QacA subfamily drug resistance transporter